MEELPCSSDDSLEVVTDDDCGSVTLTEEEDTPGRKRYGIGSGSEGSEVQSDGHLQHDETTCTIMEVGAANEHVASEGTVDSIADDSIEENINIMGGPQAYVIEEEHVSSTSVNGIDSASGDTSTDETGHTGDQENEASEIDVNVHERDANGQEENEDEDGTREDTGRHGPSGYDAEDVDLASMEELPRSSISLRSFGYDGTIQDEEDDEDTTENDDHGQDDNTQDVGQNQMKILISKKTTKVSFRLKEDTPEEAEDSSIEPKVITCSSHDSCRFNCFVHHY